MPEKKFTLDCIAAELGVAVSTICEWQKAIPEFKEAIKDLRAKAVREIESALFKGAVGFEYEETKTCQALDKKGNVTKVSVEKTKKQRPPSAAMTIFALKNLAPDQYKNDPEPVPDSDEAANVIHSPLAGPRPKRKVKKKAVKKKKK